MSVFALMNNFKIKEIPVEYRDRIEGSQSKLNTYGDDFIVIMMIAALIRDKKPLFFFSSIALILLLIAGIYFFPILFKYFSIGYILKIMLIVIATVVIVVVIIFFVRISWHVLKKQHTDNLERHLILLNELNKEK